mgnify:CR=1 FL=1
MNAYNLYSGKKKETPYGVSVVTIQVIARYITRNVQYAPQGLREFQ